MKTQNGKNLGGAPLSFNEYRFLHSPPPVAQPTNANEDFLVRPPTKPQVLVIEKPKEPASR